MVTRQPSLYKQARLLETPNGCVLLGRDDQVLFEATGRGARMKCLRRAAKSGVLRIAH